MSDRLLHYLTQSTMRFVYIPHTCYNIGLQEDISCSVQTSN